MTHPAWFPQAGCSSCEVIFNLCESYLSFCYICCSCGCILCLPCVSLPFCVLSLCWIMWGKDGGMKGWRRDQQLRSSSQNDSSTGWKQNEVKLVPANSFHLSLLLLLLSQLSERRIASKNLQNPTFAVIKQKIGVPLSAKSKWRVEMVHVLERRPISSSHVET